MTAAPSPRVMLAARMATLLASGRPFTGDDIDADIDTRLLELIDKEPQP